MKKLSDMAIDMIDGFDWLWDNHARIACGLVALAFVPMVYGAFNAAFYPFAFGVAVVAWSCVEACIIGRER